MSHVTLMNESHHTYEQVMSRIYQWVLAHIAMRPVTHINKSCLTN